ncbi:MAG: hypothetical protein QOE91_2038 [Gaiellaceae bacterium]|jgi:hypothetical protein|nr:hypothetical protein [Gaiellaceae bacterium]
MTAESLPDAACPLHLAKSEPAEGLGSCITLPTDAFGNFACGGAARGGAARGRHGAATVPTTALRACCERAASVIEHG